MTRLGFSRNSLRRDGEIRTDASLGEALASPLAGVYLASHGQWLCRGPAERPDPLFSPEDAEALLNGAPIGILLGHTHEGAPRLAAELPREEASAQTFARTTDSASGVFPAAPMDLRTLAMGELLDPDTEGQLAQAAHLLNWHHHARHCGRCGSETVSEGAGFRRRCLACDHIHFPRTDPVAIMLIHDGEGRCVLGRQARFATNSWSCLAGFIEAGETIEDAVRRESFEEAGLRIGPVRYHSSQPWPFPGSLMIGCIARADTTDIQFDTHELENCRWFERSEVVAMLGGNHPDGLVVPGPYAIAHHLIAAFARSEES